MCKLFWHSASMGAGALSSHHLYCTNDSGILLRWMWEQLTFAFSSSLWNRHFCRMSLSSRLTQKISGLLVSSPDSCIFMANMLVISCVHLHSCQLVLLLPWAMSSITVISKSLLFPSHRYFQVTNVLHVQSTSISKVWYFLWFWDFAAFPYFSHLCSTVFFVLCKINFYFWNGLLFCFCL